MVSEAMTEAEPIKHKIEEILSMERQADSYVSRMLVLLYAILINIQELGFDIPALAPKLNTAIDGLTTMAETMREVREQLQRIRDVL
jgi:hypothetical protein